MRLTLAANRKIKSPVKLIISVSWVRPMLKKRNLSSNPASAVHTASRKMTMPTKVCHGTRFPLADDSAPGKT